MKAIEIEIDGSHNEQLRFRPLQRNIRGRFDLMRIGEPMSKVKAQEWPPVPSQRLGIDPDGNGYLSEPLHDEEHAAIREKIERSGKRLEPAVTTYESIDVPSWLNYIKLAVESGIARITKGSLPDKIEGRIKRNYVLADAEPTETNRLTDALTAQSKSFDRLTDAILKLVESK